MTVICSIFRNSTSYIDRYFAQINALEQVVGDVRLLLAEGDSTDGTWDAIERKLDHRRGELIRVDHGGPEFGSIDHPQRWAQIAYVCNKVMDALPPDEPVIYVESDLIWPPWVMVQLLEDLETCDAVAPLSLRDGRFYDVWGYRGLDGTNFTYRPPYHRSLTGAELVEISSCGSCIAMRPEIAKVARFGENDCMVGLGRDIRFRAGGHLFVDTRVAVEHP